MATTVDTLDGQTAHRWLAAAMAALYAGNGIAMLATPLAWYHAIPGVTATGPFNAHFVRDIGVVFLTLSFAGALAFVRPRAGGAALLVAAAWPAGHSLVHIWDHAAGRLPPSGLVPDLVLVLLPSLAAVLLALWFIRREGMPA